MGSQRRYTYLAPSWSWASVEVPVSHEAAGRPLPQAAEFSTITCNTCPELSAAPYGKFTSGYLTVKGLLIPILYNTLSRELRENWKFVHRPDTKERAAVLSKILAGKREGWVLQLTDEDVLSSTKPKDPNWTDNAPKGLLVFADGEFYRRIGLCSIERRSWNRSQVGGTEAFVAYGEIKQITII